jgi:Kef-type K+ transport system membrane component KefB
MAILFSVVPLLRDHAAGSGTDGFILRVVAGRFGLTLLKLAGFGALCLLFSRFVEHRMRTALQRLESPAAALVSVAAVSIVIAAVAGLLGFSVAIGAFFAGLAFSRDPEAVRQRIAFDTIYDVSVPFFFIGIGLTLDLSALSALVPGLLLLLFAVIGKLLADGVLALPFTSIAGAAALGVSMIPRAEVSMLIMQKARSLGPWAAPPSAYAAMVMVSLVTTIVSPLILRRLLAARLNRS